MARGRGDQVITWLYRRLVNMMTGICGDSGADAQVVIQIDLLMDMEWNNHWLRR